MRLLVTGGSGFVGSHLIPAAVAAGHEVFALARSREAANKVEALGATSVKGDLAGERLDLPPVEGVLHLGAYFHLSGPRRPYFTINVEGTRRLLDAAKEAGARIFVDLSAAAVVMDDRGTPLADADEGTKTHPDSAIGYIASKTQAEELVLQANDRNFRTLALRPPGIWGEGAAFSSALPDMAEKNQFVWIDRGDYPVSTCHVDNLVEALLLALDAPDDACGRAYFVNDAEPVTFRAFILGLADAVGVDLSKARSLPYGVVRFIARMMETGARLRGGRPEPPLSPAMVRLIGRASTTSDRAARDCLGYIGHTTRAEGLRRLAGAARNGAGG